MRLLILLGALSLAACGDGEARLAARNEQSIASAEAAVRAVVRDPGSAVFADVKVSPTSAVCGWVNSRNGFGGMTGKKRFIVAGGAHLEEQFDPENGIFQKMWHESCEMELDEFLDTVKEGGKDH